MSIIYVVVSIAIAAYGGFLIKKGKDEGLAVPKAAGVLLFTIPVLGVPWYALVGCAGLAYYCVKEFEY